MPAGSDYFHRCKKIQAIYYERQIRCVRTSHTIRAAIKKIQSRTMSFRVVFRRFFLRWFSLVLPIIIYEIKYTRSVYKKVLYLFSLLRVFNWIHNYFHFMKWSIPCWWVLIIRRKFLKEYIQNILHIVIVTCNYWMPNNLSLFNLRSINHRNDFRCIFIWKTEQTIRCSTCFTKVNLRSNNFSSYFCQGGF